MLLCYKIRQRIVGHSVLLFSACLVGCAEPNRAQPADKSIDRNPANQELQAELLSAHCFLGSRDIDRFQPGRRKLDLLNDVGWRGDFLMTAEYKGESISVIAYRLIWGGQQREGGEVVWAIFRDDKFVKFVRWFRGEMILVDYEGTPWSRPKPREIGDINWLIRAVESEPVDIADLEREVKARPETPSQVDVGLTIAWLILRATKLRGNNIFASEEDYTRNAQLRDQFNGARLRIGMTVPEVEAVFKAKPLELGRAGAGHYRIYGSNEKFNIDRALRFSNVLILFREGKVAVVHGASPGDGWRQELAWKFIDLVPPE